MTDAIKIDGLSKFQRDLKKIDSDLPKALRIALNQAADVVVGYARPRVPKKTGRAGASIKARSTRTQVRVSEGGNRAPHMPWLDFGGAVGRRRSVRRAFLKEGRFIYKAYFDNQAEFVEILENSLLDVVKQAGIEVE